MDLCYKNICYTEEFRDNIGPLQKPFTDVCLSFPISDSGYTSTGYKSLGQVDS